MDRRQLLTRAAAGGAVWAAPTVLSGATAFAAGSVPSGTSTPSTTTPQPRVNLVLNHSFEIGEPFGAIPSWTVS